MPFRNKRHLDKVWLIPLLMFSAGWGDLPFARGQSTRITEFPVKFVEQGHSYDPVFSPDGKTLVLVKQDDGVVKLCDLTTGKAETLPNPYTKGKSWPPSVAYSKDGLLLATAYHNRGIVIWEIDARKERIRIPLERAGVHAMVFIDGKRSLVALLSTSPWNVLAVRWDVPSGTRRGTVDFGKDAIPLVLSPDGRFAVLDAKFNKSEFDLTTGVKAFDLSKVGGWAFSPNGSTLIECSRNRLSFRQAPSGKELKHFEINPGFSIGYSPLPSISSDGKLLAVQARPNGNYASLISLETGETLATVECGPPFTLADFARLSPDGLMLITQTGGATAEDKPVKPILKLWKLPASW